MNIKTDHEFNAQVDALTHASSKNAARLTKLGDMKAKWRAAQHNEVERSSLADALDAVALEVRGEQKAAAPKPAATATPAPKPAATPASPFTPTTPHG